MKAAAERASAAAEPNSSHALASEAAENEAAVERFLDESLIDEFKSTPLHTMEGVLEQRKEEEERRARIASRAEQLMQEELAKERHEKELKELKDAIATTSEPEAPGRPKRAASSKRAAAEVADVPNPFKLVESKLTGAGKSKDLKPYVYNHVDFVSTGDANRHLDALRKENEMLRRCMGDPSRPGAFSAYLRSHTAG